MDHWQRIVDKTSLTTPHDAQCFQSQPWNRFCVLVIKTTNLSHVWASRDLDTSIQRLWHLSLKHNTTNPLAEHIHRDWVLSSFPVSRWPAHQTLRSSNSSRHPNSPASPLYWGRLQDPMVEDYIEEIQSLNKHQLWQALDIIKGKCTFAQIKWGHGDCIKEPRENVPSGHCDLPTDEIVRGNSFKGIITDLEILQHLICISPLFHSPVLGDPARHILAAYIFVFGIDSVSLSSLILSSRPDRARNFLRS